MTTGRQIRAARALLDLSQDDLAQLCGLTPQGIRKIEDGTSQPREGTLSDIIRVFTDRRLEFIDNQGVRFRPEDVEVLNGRPGVERFWNKVFAVAQASNCIIRQNGISEEQLDQCAPQEAAAHRERMAPLVSKKKDIFVRAILEEGDTNFLCTEYADYRWNLKGSPPPVPCYIFGENVAIFAFEADPPPKIILITSTVISQAYSKQFDSVWQISKIPPTNKIK